MLRYCGEYWVPGYNRLYCAGYLILDPVESTGFLGITDYTVLVTSYLILWIMEQHTMTGKHGKPRPGHMTEKSIIERLLQDFCLLIDSKIKEGEDRKMERRKKDKGGFGARRRRKQRRAAAAKTPTPPTSLPSSPSPPPPPSTDPPPPTIPPDNNDTTHVDLTASNALVVANDSLLAVIEARNMEVDREFILAKGKMDQRSEFGHVMTGVTRYVPSTRSQGTRNVTRPPDTGPCEVAKTMHGSQGCKAADQQKIPNITPPDMLSVQPWYFGDIQFQMAWELMQEHAEMGNYIVLQNEELKYFLLWMSCNRTIRKMNITTEVLTFSGSHFDTWRWECSVQSWVQKQENNVDFCVQPLSCCSKVQLQKTSQTRYKLKTQNKSFVFCGFCQTFQSSIHLCPETLLWYNIDYANLVLIRAVTREGAERRSHLLHTRHSNNIKNARVFTSKAKMLASLYNDANAYWVEKENQEGWLRRKILAEANKRYEAPGDLGVNCCPTAILINDV